MLIVIDVKAAESGLLTSIDTVPPEASSLIANLCSFVVLFPKPLTALFTSLLTRKVEFLLILFRGNNDVACGNDKARQDINA